MTLVTAGRVGKPHGLDGSFWVEDARHPLPEGTSIVLSGRSLLVERRGGTDSRPLLRVGEISDPRPLRGETLLVEEVLGDGEWLASELIGCEVVGRGRVRRVLEGPSCSVLELDDGTLVPFISDAIAAIADGRIELREGFLR